MEKPAPVTLKPRSMTASTRRPAHSSGTLPLILNQLVDQGGPHRCPSVTGSYGAARPSATGTGSPGAFQIAISTGTVRAWTAGRMRWFSTRSSRCSVRRRLLCMDSSVVDGGR